MEEPEAGRAEEPCGPAEGGSGADRGWAGGGGGGGGDWMATHPTFTAMMSLDISDSSQIYAAFLVYLDLLEGNKYSEMGRTQMFFLDSWLREIMKKAALPCDDPDTPLSITLAIVETDSTIVYYKMTDGFVLPEPPDDTEDVDNKQWKRKRRKLSK